MRLYFDHNLYTRVAMGDTAAQLRSALDARGDYVMASGYNIHEASADADEGRRNAYFSSITTVASQYVRELEVYRQGLQIREEIRRCRPQWLGRLPDPEFQAWVYDQRRAYLDLWEKLQRYVEVLRTRPVPLDPALFGQFTSQLHDMKGKVMQVQRPLRAKLVQGTRGPNQTRNDWNRVTLLIPDVDPAELDRLTAGMPLWEKLWRFSGFSEWDLPLRQRARDERMFPNPALRKVPIDVRDFAAFWFADVDGDAVSITRLIGLVAMYQLDFQVTSGNAVDLHHAIHLLDCDAILTGDKRFAAVMQGAVQHLSGAGRPIFVPEECGGVALDPVQAVLNALDGA